MCEQGPGWVGDGGLLHDFDAFEETDNFEHPEDLNHAQDPLVTCRADGPSLTFARLKTHPAGSKKQSKREKESKVTRPRCTNSCSTTLDCKRTLPAIITSDYMGSA